MVNTIEEVREETSPQNMGTNQDFGSAQGKSKKSKHLIFSLDEEKYGIPLSKVKEVIGMVEITSIPHVPDFFKGVINLRGKIISIIDLRCKLSLPEVEYKAKKTSIIITELEDIVVGTIVDDVNEVAGFEEVQLERSLEIQSNVSREFITGVAKTNSKKLIVLLDISKVLSLDELLMLHKKANQTGNSVNAVRN